MSQQNPQMKSKNKLELLEYYWNREPVYDSTNGVAMPLRTIWKIRLLSLALLILYLVFSVIVIQSQDNPALIYWIVGVPLAAYCADLLSGMAHMYIDFAVSDRKNYIHKELFLSRVHHHELKRPARLNYASLWFSPALYSFVVLALLPASVGQVLPPMETVDGIVPFWLSILWFSSVSQVAHAFAHGKAHHPISRKTVGLLQKSKLIVSPRTHAIHHREIDCNFSVLNGWSIPLLNFIFKQWIEARLSNRTSPSRQKELMNQKLSYPYEEIL